MNDIIYFGESPVAQKIGEYFGEKVIFPGSRRELAERLVEKQPIQCFFYEADLLKEADRNFIFSIKRHFPLLSLVVIGEPVTEIFPYEIPVIDVRQEKDAIVDRISLVVKTEGPENRRAYDRFEWILRGRLSLDGERWIDYEVHSLSAGGAFLKSEGAAPESGKTAKIIIEFHNFRMRADCEILPVRQASSNLPAGFGIRFTGLARNSQMILDEIVSDALFKVLTDPECDVEIPSIEDPDMLSPDFEISL
jgi:hypothetical protein